MLLVLSLVKKYSVSKFQFLFQVSGVLFCQHSTPDFSLNILDDLMREIFISCTFPLI